MSVLAGYTESAKPSFDVWESRCRVSCEGKQAFAID